MTVHVTGIDTTNDQAVNDFFITILQLYPTGSPSLNIIDNSTMDIILVF